VGEHDLAGQHLGDDRELVGDEHHDVVERDDPDDSILIDDRDASNGVVTEDVNEILEVVVDVEGDEAHGHETVDPPVGRICPSDAARHEVAIGHDADGVSCPRPRSRNRRPTFAIRAAVSAMVASQPITTVPEVRVPRSS
jgi:hypothetical protein